VPCRNIASAVAKPNRCESISARKNWATISSSELFLINFMMSRYFLSIPVDG
jgi:hypothetical protein